MRVTLSERERALLLALLRGPVAGVSLDRVPRLVGWRAERVAEVLAPLAERGWMAIEPPVVRVVPWAAAWLDHEATTAGRWRTADARAPHEPLRFDPAGSDLGVAVVLLTGCDIVWRELHPRGCECGPCRDGAPPSGTRPRPADCGACKGRPLPPLWECLRCGRGGRDARRLPLPSQVRRRTAARQDDGLRGGRS